LARLGVISFVTVFFKEVPIKFKIEAVVDGKLEGERKVVANVDAIALKKELDKVVRQMEYSGIGTSLKKEGIEFYGMESIARYIIKKLKPHFPLRNVRVWEGSDEYATVFADEV
jgi:6-pyruvoyl-tetrahydropterin synthase